MLAQRMQFCLLIVLLLAAFLVRYKDVMSLSPGHDHAFLIFWSRIVSEATEVGPVGETLYYLLKGVPEKVVSLLLLHQNSLLYALSYGLYENPEKITRIIDVVLLALWFKFVGYGILQARILSILFQMGTVGFTYLLAQYISQSKAVAFFSLGLISFIPMGILFSHFVSWHTFGSFFFILTLYVMAKGVVDRKVSVGRRTWWYLSSLLWGITALSNSLIPLLLPLITGGYVGIVVQRSMKEKMKLFFFWLWPGLLILLPAAFFLIIRFKELYQSNIGYDYWNQNLYEKIILQLSSWREIMSSPLMGCAVLGILLAVTRVKRRRTLALPLLWVFFQFLLFSIISSENLFRVHLNVLPPLTFFVSLFVVTVWNRMKQKVKPGAPMAAFKGVAVALGCLICLPTATTLYKVIENPFFNPFFHSDYQEYLRSLKGDKDLVSYIERELPQGSVIFISSAYLHTMNVLLTERGNYTFVNLTALHSRHKDGGYRAHLRRFYRGYHEKIAHYIVTQRIDDALERFRTLEPAAQFVFQIAVHDFVLYRIDYCAENSRAYQKIRWASSHARSDSSWRSF